MTFPRNRRPDNTPQITVDAVIKPAANDSEVLVFTIPLGVLDIVCIVNIPMDGELSAPVYVKFVFNGLARNNQNLNQGPSRAAG